MRRTHGARRTPRHSALSTQYSALLTLALLLAIPLVASAEIGPLLAPRNVLLYRAQRYADTHLPPLTYRGLGTMTGRVTDSDGQAVTGATVLISATDGTTYHAMTDAGGN